MTRFLSASDVTGAIPSVTDWFKPAFMRILAVQGCYCCSTSCQRRIWHFSFWLIFLSLAWGSAMVSSNIWCFLQGIWILLHPLSLSLSLFLHCLVYVQAADARPNIYLVSCKLKHPLRYWTWEMSLSDKWQRSLIDKGTGHPPDDCMRLPSRGAITSNFYVPWDASSILW